MNAKELQSGQDIYTHTGRRVTVDSVDVRGTFATLTVTGARGTYSILTNVNKEFDLA